MRFLLAVPFLVACLAANSMAGGRVAATPVEIATAPGEALGFLPTSATVPVGPVVLTFRNRSRLEHNLTFLGGLGIKTRTIVQPGADEVLQISALAPGSYRFVCTIYHVTVGEMSGMLVVE